MQKDIPLLQSIMPNEFTAVLVKGRRNYLSLRRLKAAQERAKNLFIVDDEIEQLRDLGAGPNKPPIFAKLVVHNRRI